MKIEGELDMFTVVVNVTRHAYCCFKIAFLLRLLLRCFVLLSRYRNLRIFVIDFHPVLLFW